MVDQEKKIEGKEYPKKVEKKCTCTQEARDIYCQLHEFHTGKGA